MLSLCFFVNWVLRLVMLSTWGSLVPSQDICSLSHFWYTFAWQSRVSSDRDNVICWHALANSFAIWTLKAPALPRTWTLSMRTRNRFRYCNSDCLSLGQCTTQQVWILQQPQWLILHRVPDTNQAKKNTNHHENHHQPYSPLLPNSTMTTL